MFTFFISADWSKDPRKRSVYVAYLEERRIGREPPGSSGWDLEALLALARELSHRGRVLIGVDLALGVSRGYWRLVLDERRRRRPATFVEWLSQLDPFGEFFQETAESEQWRVGRPWFAIPPVPGGRKSFEKKVGDGFLRRIDAATGAKPLFAISGIPGTVGSGTRDFWKEVIPCLARERDFAIWPFEEDLTSPRSGYPIVLAESYPGLAYAVALAERLPARRIRVAKTRRAEREFACGLLVRAEWVAGNRVDLGGLDAARASEDDFDAHLMASAVLRCAIEGSSLGDRDWIDPVVEGSMLLAGPVDPEAKAGKLNAGPGRCVTSPKR